MAGRGSLLAVFWLDAPGISREYFISNIWAYTGNNNTVVDTVYWDEDAGKNVSAREPHGTGRESL
jgi:hypothetical protein